jgi:hypothetical protein
MPLWLRQSQHWPLSQMFRVQKEQSWSSRLSSSAGRIKRSPLTIMKHGFIYSQNTNSSKNTHSSPRAFNLVLMLVSVPSIQPSPLIIAPPFMHIQNSTKKSWTENSALEDTLGPAPRMKLKASLALSNPHLCLSSPSLAKLKNIKLYIIFLFCIHHKMACPLLITLLTLTSSPAPGEPLRHYAHSYGTFQKDPKHQYMMSLRLTAQFPSSQPNGLVSLPSYKNPISSLSTQMTTLASHQQGVYMGQLLMQELIFLCSWYWPTFKVD